MLFRSIYDKLVVVPAKAGVDGPFAEMDEILDESGLFEIGAAIRKCEGRRSAGIERIEGIVGTCGDDIAEVFVEKEIVGFEAGLPLVAAVVDGDGGVEVSLFEVVVQKNSDGPGTVVGIEIGRASCRERV